MRVERAESADTVQQPVPVTPFAQQPVAEQAAVNDAAWTRAGVRGAVGRAVRWVRSLGPYVAIELILPGGSIIALALWTYRNRRRVAARYCNGK